jgi:hypothetical protein
MSRTKTEMVASAVRYNLLSRGTYGLRTAARPRVEIQRRTDALLPGLLRAAGRTQVQALLPAMRLLHELRGLLLSRHRQRFPGRGAGVPGRLVALVFKRGLQAFQNQHDIFGRGAVAHGAYAEDLAG